MFSPVYELQSPLLLDTMIANAEYESHACDSNLPCPGKKRKRGLGKGGTGAKYSTISVATHMAQFPNEPFEERLALQNNSTTAAQNALSNNIRHMRLAAHFNGDIEDRFIFMATFGHMLLLYCHCTWEHFYNYWP